MSARRSARTNNAGSESGPEDATATNAALPAPSNAVPSPRTGSEEVVLLAAHRDDAALSVELKQEQERLARHGLVETMREITIGAGSASAFEMSYAGPGRFRFSFGVGLTAARFDWTDPYAFIVFSSRLCRMVERWSGHIFDRELTHLMLPAAVLLYQCFYDGFASNFISRIYQQDKYGIVLLYALISILKTYDTISCMSRGCQFDIIKQEAHRNERLLPQETEAKLNTLGRRNETVLLLSILKVIAFTMIFKNNTSNEKAHQLIHVAMVLILGPLALLAKAYHKLRIDEGYALGPWFVRLLLAVVAFQGIASAQEANLLPRTWMVNAIVACTEAWAIAKTI